MQPITYASQTLQPHERNYGSTELEALGVVWTVRHFRQYLYGHHCHVFTDFHEVLKSLLPQQALLVAWYEKGHWNMVQILSHLECW